MGHLAAVKKLTSQPGMVTYNLGTGIGYSVLDIINAFEKANNLTLPYIMGSRRAGDIASSFTDPAKALRELGWRATRDLTAICRDAWRWQQQYPDGYAA